MSTEVQGDGSGVALPEIVTINRQQLREAIGEYIIQSRTGAVLSYQATAAMSADDVADSSTRHLWGLLQTVVAQGTLGEPLEALPAQGAEFIAAEDIGAGQWVTFNEHGQIIALATTPKAQITLVEDKSRSGPSDLDIDPKADDSAGGFFDA